MRNLTKSNIQTSFDGHVWIKTSRQKTGDLNMKLNEQIGEHRKKVGLTQEQVGNYLGVSTPAVNKWESGSTYPDITLLSRP